MPDYSCASSKRDAPSASGLRGGVWWRRPRRGVAGTSGAFLPRMVCENMALINALGGNASTSLFTYTLTQFTGQYFGTHLQFCLLSLKDMLDTAPALE